MMSDKTGLQGRAGNNADVEKAAGNWFAVMRSGSGTEQEADDFKIWYNADPRHQKAYCELEKVWELSGDFAEKAEVRVLREEVLHKTAPSHFISRFRLLAFIIAAILIAAFLFMAL